MKDCLQCSGVGQVSYGSCPSCQGTGKLPHNTCTFCAGHGAYTMGQFGSPGTPGFTTCPMCLGSGSCCDVCGHYIATKGADCCPITKAAPATTRMCSTCKRNADVGRPCWWCGTKVQVNP